MGSLRPWDDEARAGAFKGFPLAIVATGPSFDLVPRWLLEKFHVFALNAAITEFWNHECGCTWVCHDLWKIWRHDLRSRIKGYDRWNLITRRVYVPGEFGAVPWKAPDGSRVEERFVPAMRESDAARSDINWYNELEGEDGHLKAEEGVLEVALTAARVWGFSPVVIVGADLAPGKRLQYAKPWKWKRCAIKPPKFARMREALHRNRERWPDDTYLVESGWKDSPFKALSVEGLKGLVSRLP